MILTDDMYVPALRWRQGEYQASFDFRQPPNVGWFPSLRSLESNSTSRNGAPRSRCKSMSTPSRHAIGLKWNQIPAWIGVHASIADQRMDDGRDVLAYTFENLRTFQANGVPALPLDASPIIVSSVRAIINVDGAGAAISIRLEDLMKPNPRARIEALASSIGLAIGETDLVVDLGAPHFSPYDAFSNALIAALYQLRDLHDFRNFILLGTAIPETFRDVAKGAEQLPRSDWLFYQKLISKIPR